MKYEAKKILNKERSWPWFLSNYQTSQRKIINDVGISWPAWNSILNGADMKMSTFFKICKGLDINFEEAILEEKLFQEENRK